MSENTGIVYTLYNECQDCYKCVRRCPVKSIRIQDGHACVIAEKCIECGRCVAHCPSQAKRVRNDLEKVRQLINSGKQSLCFISTKLASFFFLYQTTNDYNTQKIRFFWN